MDTFPLVLVTNPLEEPPEEIADVELIIFQIDGRYFPVQFDRPNRIPLSVLENAVPIHRIWKIR